MNSHERATAMNGELVVSPCPFCVGVRHRRTGVSYRQMRFWVNFPRIEAKGWR